MTSERKREGRGIVTGLHILGGVYTNEMKKLNSSQLTKTHLSKLIRRLDLHELGSFYHRFPEGGFTGLVSLVESHIAVHTWPELGYLTLDVYLCDYSRDNRKICRLVFNEITNFFRPTKVVKRLIVR